LRFRYLLTHQARSLRDVRGARALRARRRSRALSGGGVMAYLEKAANNWRKAQRSWSKQPAGEASLISAKTIMAIKLRS